MTKRLGVILTRTTVSLPDTDEVAEEPSRPTLASIDAKIEAAARAAWTEENPDLGDDQLAVNSVSEWT